MNILNANINVNRQSFGLRKNWWIEITSILENKWRFSLKRNKTRNLSLIGIILRWGFLIWELIFIYCGLFFLILVFFFFVFFLCCFFFHYVSAKFPLWPSSGDLPRPRIGMLSLVTVSPVITAFHSCCLSHHVFDVIRLKKKKKKKNISTVDRPSGPVAQRIEALSLCGSRWVLSEDSGFKSYPSWPEVYLYKKILWLLKYSSNAITSNEKGNGTDLWFCIKKFKQLLIFFQYIYIYIYIYI